MPRRPSRDSSSPPPAMAAPSEPPPLFEADLLNLGGAPAPTIPVAPPPAATTPGLDIFGHPAASNAGGNGDDLFAGFGAFAQAPPPANTPVVNEPRGNDLLFGQTNGKPSNMGDLLFGGNPTSSSGQTAPRPTPTADDMMFDPFGSNSKENLLGKKKFCAPYNV